MTTITFKEDIKLNVNSSISIYDFLVLVEELGYLKNNETFDLKEINISDLSQNSKNRLDKINTLKFVEY